jgi:hypothetical protein
VVDVNFSSVSICGSFQISFKIFLWVAARIFALGELALRMRVGYIGQGFMI